MCTQFLLTLADLLGARRSAAAATSPGSAELPEQDLVYVNYAHQSAVFEVIVGNLAATKATCSRIRDLGAEVARHHSALGADLITVSAHHGIRLNDVLDTDQAGRVAELSTLAGADFDSIWLRAQVDAHLRLLTLGVLELTFGSSEDVKHLALAAEPVLNSQLDELITALAQCASRDSSRGSGGN